MLPIVLLGAYFKILKQLLNRFIWRSKKPRISMEILIRDKERGGLGVPDIYTYYTAIHMARVVDWVRDNNEKRWVRLESCSNKSLLGKEIWIPPHFRQQNTHMHTITLASMSIWDRVHKKHRWGYNSPLIPLFDTNFFAPGKIGLFGN